MDFLEVLENPSIRKNKKNATIKTTTKPKPYNSIYSKRTEREKTAITPIYSKTMSKKKLVHPKYHSKGFENDLKTNRIEFQPNLTHSINPKYFQPPRLHKKFEDTLKFAISESPISFEENKSQKKALSISESQKYALNIGIQTDYIQPKIQEPEFYPESETDRIKYIEEKDRLSKTSFHSSNDSKFIAKHRALVNSSKISIELKEYTIKYFINSSLDLLYIQVNSPVESYEMKYSISPEDSILDIIHNEIQPKIQIRNGELVLEDIHKENVLKGMQIWKENKAVVIIDAVKPRFDLLVTFEKNSKIFKKKYDYMEIIKYFGSSGFDVKFFFCFLWARSDEIGLRHIDTNSIQLVYYRNHKLDNKNNYYVRISQADYGETVSFLIEAVSNSAEKISPLLINSETLSGLLNITEKSIIDKIDLVVRSITIENSQILIAKRACDESFSSRKPSIKSTGKSEKSYSNISKKSFNFSEEECEKLQIFHRILKSQYESVFFSLKKSGELKKIESSEPSRAITPIKTDFLDIDYSKIDLAKENSPSLDPKNSYFNKIFYRTCVTKNEKIFQISIVLTKTKKNEEILVFNIRHGSSAEDMQKFSIDLKTICEKTGLTMNYLSALGSYVVRNMLVLGDNDISYLDFSKEKFNAIAKITKIQAIMRGVLQRKMLKIEKKHFLLKNKILINDVKWTSLVYTDSSKIYIKLINGIKVASIELNKLLIAYDGSANQIETYIKKVLYPKIKLKTIDKEIKIIGLEKFQFVGLKPRGSFRIE